MRIIRGVGVNEDRIAANVARRKAVAEKRDEAQAFLANIAKEKKMKSKRDEAQSFLSNIGQKQKAYEKKVDEYKVRVKRDKAQEFLANFPEKQRLKKLDEEQAKKPQPSSDYIKQYKYVLNIKLVLDDIYNDMDTDGGYYSASKAYDKAVEKMGSIVPDKYTREIQESFDSDRGETIDSYAVNLRDYDIDDISDGSYSDYSYFVPGNDTSKLLRKEAKLIIKIYKAEKKRLNI